MKCEQCGHENKPKALKDHWCMYQVKDGQVVNKLFDPDNIPKGWYESPKAAKAAKPIKPKLQKANNLGLAL